MRRRFQLSLGQALILVAVAAVVLFVVTRGTFRLLAGILLVVGLVGRVVGLILYHLYDNRLFDWTTYQGSDRSLLYIGQEATLVHQVRTINAGHIRTIFEGTRCKVVGDYYIDPSDFGALGLGEGIGRHRDVDVLIEDSDRRFTIKVPRDHLWPDDYTRSPVKDWLAHLIDP